ncbi:MAG: hypothetical protein HHJ18_17775 [Polaromonas sp.]|nr:hypothetical protein [Polaromonas sp.]
MIVKLRKRGVRCLLCEANERVRAKMWKAGILELLGEQNFHHEFSQVLARAVAELEANA